MTLILQMTSLVILILQVNKYFDISTLHGEDETTSDNSPINANNKVPFTKGNTSLRIKTNPFKKKKRPIEKIHRTH